MSELKSLTGWSECSSCAFSGTVVFTTRADEDYDDLDSLGVMLDAKCPACGENEPVLVMRDQYDEMVFLANRPALE